MKELLTGHKIFFLGWSSMKLVHLPEVKHFEQ